MRLGSYFGGLLCCCWSRDGRYLISGGEDDMVRRRQSKTPALATPACETPLVPPRLGERSFLPVPCSHHAAR